jgi:hypothetical protein
VLASGVVLGGFRAADYQLAAKEFLIVQFRYRAPSFLNRLHLNESETFGALIVPITYHFGILDVADTVEELEQIAFGGVERQIADVQTRRADFDRLRFPGWAMLLCAVR